MVKSGSLIGVIQLDVGYNHNYFKGIFEINIKLLLLFVRVVAVVLVTLTKTNSTPNCDQHFSGQQILHSLAWQDSKSAC